jgi:hypothetical protein
VPTGPIVIGYDGSAASEHALREAGGLLAPIDVWTAAEVDRRMYEGAQRTAEHGQRAGD